MGSSSASTPSSMFLPISYSTPPSNNGGAFGNGRMNYIEHPVSKFDTLAGVAIKYGVEVADIKKINGLVTDLQMFALKTLYIPLPGRHPPSPSLSNGYDPQGPSSSEQTPPNRRHSDFLDSFPSLKLKTSPQPKVSPAMGNLQGYYGLKPIDQKSISAGCEMAVYRNGGSCYLDDEPFAKPSALSNPPLSHHKKSKSVANGLILANGAPTNDVLVLEAREDDSEKWIEKLVRRRQKSEADFGSCTPETMLLEDNGSSSGGFSAITGKGLALRPKAASRTNSIAEAEAGWQNPTPINLGESFVAESFSGVRKSSSTSSLQDSESSTSSFLWADLQTLSTAAITRPIFDGLPKPMTGRRNKAALD